MRVVAGIIKHEGEILLVHQQGDDDPAPCWALPGGVVESDEDLLTALHREIGEETGLTVRSIDRLAWVVEVIEFECPTLIAFIFEITVEDGQFAPNDPDSYILDIRYMPEDDALRLIGETVPWPEMREPLLAYLEGEDRSSPSGYYRYDNR